MEGEEIIALPAVSNTSHPLYQYFDQGFHLRCFENWDKKNEALDLVKEEKKKFMDSDFTKKWKPNMESPNGLMM